LSIDKRPRRHLRERRAEALPHDCTTGSPSGWYSTGCPPPPHCLRSSASARLSCLYVLS